MAEIYDFYHPRSTTSTSLETVVSTSRVTPTSTNESMWEGWAQTSPTLTEQQVDVTNTKNGTSSQHDLLSSWLMCGYQTAGMHQQHQHGGEQGSGTTTMYHDEFSRMNICSATSSTEYDGVASPQAVAGSAGSSDVSRQLYDVIPTCRSSVHPGNDSEDPTEVGKSTRFLDSPTLDHNVEAAHQIDVNANEKMMHHMEATTGLGSRASSSSPPSGFNSYRKAMEQHLGVQLDSSSYWASTSSAPAVTASSLQPSDCVGGDVFSSGQLQGEHQQPNTSCDSIILHHQQHQSSRKVSCEVNETLFLNSVTDLSTSDQMYAELHGLFSKTMATPAQVTAVDHDHHQLAICGGEATTEIGNFGDHSSGHSNWAQFNVSPTFCTPSSDGEGFSSIQEVVHQTMFDSSMPDSLSTASHATTRKDDTSPSSAGTAISAIHNFNAAAGAAATGHTQTASPYRSSSSNLASPEMALQRKRPLSKENEQVEENSAEDSVKRSCIVRCLWEQNIAQLQLANLPSEQQRNLWQLQSQALFGRLPSNFLSGGSGFSNSGTVDMNTSIGPALNTNGRPRARRGSATDPQSVYARHRRERINDRLKVLQHLVPNGAKVDIVTMLEEAINYVKFLQLQVRLLSSDELWIYAPTTYNGVDVSMGVHAGLLNS